MKTENAKSKEEVEANVKQWIADLRSGNFKQSKYNLHTSNGFCCLGVACKQIADKDTRIITKEVRRIVGTAIEYGYNENDIQGGLPVDGLMEDYFGMTSNDPRVFTHNCVYYSLSELNDDLQFTFNEIANANDNLRFTFNELADVIESQPPGLFREEFGKLNLT